MEISLCNDICHVKVGSVDVQCIDLAYSLDKDTIYWPTDELGFQLCMNCSGEQSNQTFYAAGSFSCAEHGGTHVDAPYHFNQEGLTVDQLSLSQLIRPLRVIDVTKKIFLSDGTMNTNYSLHVDDILSYEASYGALNEGDIVLVHTGWSRCYPQGSKAYLGYDRHIDGPYDPDQTELAFPGISADASHLFVNRKVTAVGLDTGKIVMLSVFRVLDAIFLFTFLM
jgi:kynurenine formamidase